MRLSPGGSHRGNHPSPRHTVSELRALAILPTVGTYKRGADRLGIKPSAFKMRMQSARRRAGVETNLELYVALGWLTPPADQ